jgi:hypothetical protein
MQRVIPLLLIRLKQDENTAEANSLKPVASKSTTSSPTTAFTRRGHATIIKGDVTALVCNNLFGIAFGFTPDGGKTL